MATNTHPDHIEPHTPPSIIIIIIKDCHTSATTTSIFFDHTTPTHSVVAQILRAESINFTISNQKGLHFFFFIKKKTLSFFLHSPSHLFRIFLLLRC